jgi:hypothetical protein
MKDHGAHQKSRKDQRTADRDLAMETSTCKHLSPPPFATQEYSTIDEGILKLRLKS